MRSDGGDHANSQRMHRRRNSNARCKRSGEQAGGCCGWFVGDWLGDRGAGSIARAEVIVASSNAERIQKAVATIRGEVQGHAVDVSDEAAVEAFFTKVGAFDHLVVTPAYLHLNDLATTDLQQARRAFELRYRAALAAVKYGSPRVRLGGSIVLTTGMASQRPQKGWVVAASVCGS